MHVLEQITKFRRDLHKIPETSRNLPKTKAYILSILKSLDCEITEVMESGICAYFDRSQSVTTAYRADMDALPVTEICEHAFVSQHPGKMHACGHDGHMAMCLALAQYVDSHKELPCNVLIIFQPAEETTGGAREICETGILSRYNVDRIFSTHMWPHSPAGSISSRPGPMMPRSSELSVEIIGKSSHATDPACGIDALYIAVRYIQEVYDRKKREERPNPSPDQRTIIQICKFESGTARNIISGCTNLLGTMRAFSEEDFQSLLDIVYGVAEELSSEYNCQIKVTHTEGYPPIINNEQLYDEVMPTLASALDNYIEMPEPAMISEDYSFYGLYVPSVFFYVGTGTGVALHAANFDFDESVLLQGVELFKTLLWLR